MADIEADVWYIPTAAGGKRLPVTTGYRPQSFYEGQDHGALHEYPHQESVQPGEKTTVRLTFLHPQNHLGRVHVGMPFLIREGAKTVGYGVVRAILDLEATATAAIQRAASI